MIEHRINGKVVFVQRELSDMPPCRACGVQPVVKGNHSSKRLDMLQAQASTGAQREEFTRRAKMYDKFIQDVAKPVRGEE